MTRLHGRAPRGERLHAKVPYGHWKTMTFIAALRHDRIDAPCVLDGPVNGTRFLAYVRQFLLPTLKPGDIVVMDNLSPQTPGRAPSHTFRRCQALVLATLQPRPEPNRAGLCQAQDALAAR